MNLETRLDQRLWAAIRTSAEARSFSAAVLDAIHFLSDVIRERSGLEGDGVALVGAAFGGASPKLKVNRLQTESEQSVQKGVEALLRGVYQAIRNPRSHETHQDAERDAVAIILFLDYLLRIVDQSRTPFSLSTFVGRVLDPDFVPNTRYAELLVKEIPETRRLAVCREVFSRRTEADASKARFFFEHILDVMSGDEKAELTALLSDELAQTDDDATIRFVVKAFPLTVWPQLSELARLRIENKFVGSIKEGRYSRATGKCLSGSLGTWSSNILAEFTLKGDLWGVVFRKLLSGDDAEKDYAFIFFISLVQDSFASPPPLLVMAMLKGLKAGDARFKAAVDQWRIDGFEERKPDDPWRKPFEKALAEFEHVPQAFEITDDDVPF